MKFLSINNYTNIFIIKLLVYIQLSINKFLNILFTIYLWTRGTQQKNTIVTPKINYHTLHSPLLMKSFNVCPQSCVHLILISFQQNGVNFTFREAINIGLVSLHRFCNNLYPTCPNHNIMKILWCSINKKLSSHKIFNCIHLSVHLFVHYDGVIFTIL
jgi:hypothetical protein